MTLRSPSKKFIENARLSAYTTFKLGGPCKGLIHCQTPEELIEAVREFREQRADVILMGGGSNLVVCDGGLDCYVIRYFSPTPYIQEDNGKISVSGSTVLDDL